MLKARLKALIGDTRGRGTLRFILAACVLALVILSITPEFRDDPLLKAPLVKLRHHLPAMFDTITDALNGGGS